MTDPQLPPHPKNTRRLVQDAGSFSTNAADPGPAPSPPVVTVPSTEQYSGLGGAAGMSVAEAIETWGTANPESVETEQFGRAADAGSAEKAEPTANIDNASPDSARCLLDMNFSPRPTNLAPFETIRESATCGLANANYWGNLVPERANTEFIAAQIPGAGLLLQPEVSHFRMSPFTNSGNITGRSRQVSCRWRMSSSPVDKVDSRSG
jgi:hypothetical protein